MKTPPIVSAAEWDEALERLLVKEKELTRARAYGQGGANPAPGYFNSCRAITSRWIWLVPS